MNDSGKEPTRRAFEKWAKPRMNLDREERRYGYRQFGTQCAWEAWQGAVGVDEIDGIEASHVLHGDALLAHNQCRAVAHLAKALAEVHEQAGCAMLEHEPKYASIIGPRTAGIMEYLGDVLNGMDACDPDEDAWLDPIFEAAQERWPTAQAEAEK